MTPDPAPEPSSAAGKGKTGACLLLLHRQFLQPDHDFKKETFPIVVGRDTQE